MIEKLKPEIKELFGVECPIYNSQALLDTVNQLVDAVNELQTRPENVQSDAESRQENVQDKFAEQRKWIGKLCRFWDDNYKITKHFGILTRIDETAIVRYEAENGFWYCACEPVKPDSELIYHGE